MNICSDCPPNESTARRIAAEHGLNEYLIIHRGRHWRKRLLDGLHAPALWQVEFWHAFVRAALERKAA